MPTSSRFRLLPRGVSRCGSWRVSAVAAAVGLRFSSSAQYALGSAGQYSAASKVWCVRFLENAAPTANATTAIAGQGDYGATGFVLGSKSYAGQPTGRGNIDVFGGGAFAKANSGQDNVGTPTDTQLARKQLRTAHIFLDGGRIHFLLDGEEQSIGGVTAVTDLGSAAALAINRRSSSVANQYGDVSVVEIQSTDAALSRREMRIHSRARPGTAMRGTVLHHFMAQDLGSPGTSPAGPWVSRINGAHTLTLTGSPSLVSIPLPKAFGIQAEIRGDSIAAGRDGAGTLNEGWRRAFQLKMNTVRTCMLNGFSAFSNVATPLDFDSRHTAAGNRGLGQTPGGGATDLSLIQNDVGESRWLYVHRRGWTVCAFGVNDVNRRIVELSQTPAQCVASMTTDWDTWILRVRHARSGPIIICGTLREADASSTANERTAIDLWNAGLPALVATWHAKYGDIYFFDAHGTFVNTYGATYYNDTTNVLLPDGTHLRPAANTVYGEALAGVCLSVPDPLDDPYEIFGADALTGWWDHLSDGQTGASWANRVSSSATALTQANPTFQPAAGTPINGRSTLQSDGVDDFMDDAAISVLLTATAYGIWTIARPLGTLLAQTPINADTDLFVTDVGGYIAQGMATDPRGVSFSVLYERTSSPGTMVSGTVYQVRSRVEAGTLYFRLRDATGTLGEGTAAVGAIGAMGGGLRLARTYTVNNFFTQVDFGAVITTKRAPTADEQAAMDTWIFALWGV